MSEPEPWYTELRNDADTGAYYLDWYCARPPEDAEYEIVREEPGGHRIGHPVRKIFEVRGPGLPYNSIPTAYVRCGGLGPTCFDGQATGLFAIQGLLKTVDAEHAQSGHQVQFTVTWYPRGGGGHGPGGQERTDGIAT